MQERIVIYGAGFAGKVLATYFEICQKKAVEALIVSKGHRELEYYQLSPAFQMNKIIPVLELDDLRIDETLVVYNTVIAGHHEVFEALVNKGVRPEQIKTIEVPCQEVFRVFFEKLQIDLTQDIIDFNGVKLYNFLEDNSSFYSIFIGTLGDELLPGIYGDVAFAVDGPYENDWIKIKNGDVIVDAGANLGLYSCYAAAKGCNVYACDPDSRCLAVLEKQKELYPTNIIILPIGLSDSMERVTYYESDVCALSSLTMPRGSTVEKTIQLSSIDALVENGTLPRVDYIKADIEGAERNMLRGARNTLKTFAPKLSICTYHYKEDPKLLEQIIKEANPDYVVTHAWRKLYAYVPES